MKNNYLRLLLILIPLVIYLSFLSPSIGAGDSGELVSSAYTLGIPHPPGYPFYMILGRVFSLLFPSNPAIGMNLLSALFAIGAVLLLFQILLDKGFKGAISFIPALLLSLHPLLLKNATISEVYTLTAFFFLLELLLLKRERYQLLSFIVGLSFLIHPLLWIVGTYLLYRIIKKDYRYLLYSLIGFSIILYLPIRSIADPLIDWGNPESPGRLLAHFLRLEYYRGVFVPFSLSVVSGELLIYFKILIRDANFLLILIPFAFIKEEREYLLLLLIYSFPLALLLHFEPGRLNLEANRIFFLPQIILILILSVNGLERLNKKFLPIGAVFLISVFCLQSYRERLFIRSWTAPDYFSTVLEQTEDDKGEVLPVIQSRGDALTFPLLYAEVLTKRIRVRVNTPGLKIHIEEPPDYSTYWDEKFRFYDRVLFAKEKNGIKPWNFYIRQGRKDILEDELYIKALTHYAIYLHNKGNISSSLVILKRAKRLAWLNQHLHTVASAYIEIGKYEQSVDILRTIQREDSDYPGIYHLFYYSLTQMGESEEAEGFLSYGLLTQDDESLLNDAGAYYAERGFINVAFLFFLKGVTKGVPNAGANLNKLIQEEILK